MSTDADPATPPESSSNDPPAAAPPPPQHASTPPQPSTPQQLPRRRGRPPRRTGGSLWWVWALALVGLVLFGGFFLLLVVAAASAAPTSGKRSLTEQEVEPADADATEEKLALIRIDGVIQRQVTTGGLIAVNSFDLVERLQAQFDQAGEDDLVKGVLLSIDSPGGTVTASDQIWHLIQEFKAEHPSKKIVVHMGAVCASGGYYIAAAADKIVCEPTTITGSIGVILSGLNFHDLLKEHGVRDVTIASGPNKALLSSTAPMSEEHQQILHDMVMDSYQRFTQIVADGRQIPVDEVRGFADGRIYTPTIALQLKLVDQIGYRADAVALLESQTGLTDAKLVRFSPRPPTLADVLAGNAQAAPPPQVSSERDVVRWIEHLRTPRLLALWRPN